MRHYMAHHKHIHLQEYSYVCQICNLSFWNQTQMSLHRCLPDRCDYNRKRCEVQAKRNRDQLAAIPEPYYIVVDGMSSAVDVVLGKACYKASASANPLSVTNIPGLQISSENTSVTDDIVHSLLNKDCPDGQDTENTLSFSHTAVCSSVPKVNDLDPEQINIESVDQESVGSKPVDGEPIDVKAVNDKPEEQVPVPKTGTVVCMVCGKNLRPRNYHPHMRRVHKVELSRKPIEWKVCEKCGYKCQDNYKLRRHSLTHSGPGKFLVAVH